MVRSDFDEPRRSSIEKRPFAMADDPPPPSAFHRLPDEIIYQILQVTDPNGFASLVSLNSKWRSVSQQALLYAHHLADCSSFSSARTSLPATLDDSTLPELRRLFAKEVKRNLFEAYLRPNQTVIKVISNSISSSSCPGGEGIQFSSSPRGHHLLAYNSSRIYVVDVRSDNIEVKRELKILRRPAAICINDDGSKLAVLLTEMQIDLYDLSESPPKRTKSIILDHSPRAIALSPCGAVLAAAYEGGIEVSSLQSTEASTDKRAVKCDAVDSLAFSFDGTQILGTTVHSSQPNTVIITAPYYDPGTQMADDSISGLWTTSILFPNSSRDCSHAVLLQNGHTEEAGWAFTYDRSFETFRAVRIDDLRNGTTYFTGPIPNSTSQAKLIPCTLPAASYHGELVSAGFQGKEIWLYGVPDALDAVPESANAGIDSSSSAGGLNRRNSGPSVRSPSRVPESNETAIVPKWQMLCDKYRNTFVGGFKIAELDGVSTVKWVADFGGSSLKERLIVAARGAMPPKPITEDNDFDFVDGGRITLIDFDYGIENGRVTEVSIDVGTKEPETLEEERRDIDTEVAIVRRRTVALNRSQRDAIMRTATTTARPPALPLLPTLPSASQAEDGEDDPLIPRRIGQAQGRTDQPLVGEEAETESIIEEQEALDAPYSHASPRSGTTLRRAATAAAANRRLHPSAAAGGHIVYRRADGRQEHPHESDADNWVPPPPPYQKEDPGDMPDYLRHTVPTVVVNTAPSDVKQSDEDPRDDIPQQSALPPVPPVPPMPPQQPLTTQVDPPSRQDQRQRVVEQTSSSVQGMHGAENLSPPNDSESPPRPVSSQSCIVEGENIYDITPPGSPTSRAQATLAPPASEPAPMDNNSTLPVGDASTHSPTPSSPGQQTRLELSPLQTNPLPSHTTIVESAKDFTPTQPRNFSRTLPNAPSDAAPHVRPLSNAQTWPVKPPNSGPPAAPAAGYPYSAPATNLGANEILAQAYPPAPTADQLARLHSRAEVAPRRLSGGFHVPRVPVGSRIERENTFPLSHSNQHPPSAHQQQGRTSSMSGPSTSLSQPGYRHSQPIIPVLHQPQPRREHPPPPVEDTPLIISTPKGVSGAFDPPDRRSSGRSNEPRIIAPVPRNPQRSATQAAVLRQRPTTERLETIYSVASHQTHDFLDQPAHQQMRVPSLNRGASRAERSAARNMADAKRRGWTGRRKSKRLKRKQEELKARNGGPQMIGGDPLQGQGEMGLFTSVMAQPNEGMAREGKAEKEKRCIVM